MADTKTDTLACAHSLDLGENLQPAPRLSCLSRLFFFDIDALVRKAARTKKLEFSDLWGTPNGVEELYEEFEWRWAKEQEKPKSKVRVRRVFFAMNRGLIICAICLQLLGACGQFSGPLILNTILTIIAARQGSDCDENGALGPKAFVCQEWAGYALCSGLFCALTLGLMCQNLGNYILKLVAIRIRGVLISAVYLKSMKLSSVGMSKVGTGMITNLTSNDAEQLLMSVFVMGMVIIAPLQLVVCFALLAIYIGATFLAGMVVVVLLIGLAVILLIKSAKYKIAQSKAADNRILLTKELLAGVKIVKAYGWVIPFEAEVRRLRGVETRALQIQMYYRSFMVVVIISAPVMLATTTFSTFVATGGTLSPATVFTSFAIMNLMRGPLAFLPFAMIEANKVVVAFGRLQGMLLAEEREGAVAPAGGKLEIVDSEFGYHHNSDKGTSKGKGKGGGCLARCLGKLKGGGKGKVQGRNLYPSGSVADLDGSKGAGKGVEAPPVEEVDDSTLADVQRNNGEVIKMKRILTVDHFAPTPGGLTLIIGLVGSGKSTLLAAILNEVEVIKGAYASRPERIGYAAQTPWIINTTLEKNIKIGAPDRGEEWYTQVVDKCCLNADVDILPAGDQTEIGGRGVNLSGGQKARVAVARTVYRDCDLYLFDDPLAAVDAHVGKRLFDEVLGNQGILAGKTRVLVTHQVQYASLADQVVVVEDGRVTAAGSYNDLLSKGIEFERMVTPAAEVPDGTDAIAEVEENVAADGAKAMPNKVPAGRTQIGLGKDGELVKAEVATEGAVGLKTYWQFAKQGVSLRAVVLTVIAMMMGIITRLASDFWLALWSEDSEVLGLQVSSIIIIYCAIAILQAVSTYCRSIVVMAYGMIKASRNMYHLLYHSVFHAKPVFFDVQPLGRILNRFTADIDVVDNNLPGIVAQTTGTIELVVASLTAIIISDKFVVLLIIPCVFAYGLLVGKYRHFARDIQRLESISKSPILTRITETLDGLSSVRASGYQAMFKVQTLADIDLNQACTLLRERAQLWLSMRLEMLSVCISAASALFPLLPFAIADARAAFVGVALTHSLELAKFTQGLTQMLAQLEQKFTSPERIFEYCALESEAPNVAAPDAALPAGWPLKGGIEFKDVTMRYRPELDPALRGVSFSVQAGEKLGIVGRTGSGKSSIIVTLLRLTEREGGIISIDGQDLRQLGLQRLRTSLSMIPQEPVLFGNTTLRLNLDPFNEHSDAVLLDALTKVQMNKDDCLVNGLETKVSEDGGGFSLGQRQLLCLARAVLRHSRVILLDEATASVDGETDDQIQKTIRETFVSSTVLCIAHRIRTILDSDRVLVMAKGVCQELGSPAQLLNTAGSELRALAVESGIDVPALAESTTDTDTVEI